MKHDRQKLENYRAIGLMEKNEDGKLGITKVYRQFTSIRSQILNQTPELVDC
jgi:hypothetical protein